MAVTINADTSNGLVMTPDTSGEIKLQSAGADIVSVTANGMAVDTNTLYVDATNNNVGIGTSSINPSFAPKLEVYGTANNGTEGLLINTFAPTLTFLDRSGSGTTYQIKNDGAILSFRYEAGASGSFTERMRIDSGGNLRFNSGYGSVATAYGCRAWVNFNGTGTVAIRGSGGVSSITDTGTGRYRVNFATAMPDTNYSVSTCGVTNGSNDRFANCLIINTQYTTTYCGLLRWNSSTYDDEDRIQFQAFR
jgi:hypothetical protein